MAYSAVLRTAHRRPGRGTARHGRSDRRLPRLRRADRGERLPRIRAVLRLPNDRGRGMTENIIPREDEPTKYECDLAGTDWCTCDSQEMTAEEIAIEGAGL